jgi:ABC-type Fe3+-hydroxamate transport system substrate-binding protein
MSPLYQTHIAPHQLHEMEPFYPLHARVCGIGAKRAGKTIAGYGAPGKGNTLLNYCGIRTDFLDYTVDRNPYKQGKYTPGTHIPILSPDRIRETKPDYIFILPWNLKDEIMKQLAYVREWGGQFVVPIPEVKVF